MHTPAPPPHIPALTGLRFLAALHVVIYHLWRHEAWQAPEAIVRVIAAGPASVTLFFVLSGYLLTHRYRVRSPSTDEGLENETEKLRISLSAYLRGRLARIYPVHLLGWVCVAPVAFVLWKGQSPGVESLWPSFWAPGIWVLALLQAWHPAHALAWNPPAWSLSVEIFCYLVFPFLLTRIHFRSIHRLYVATVLVWLASLTLSAALAWYASHAPTIEEKKLWVHVFKFHPLVRIPEFVLGMMLAEWVRHHPVRLWRSPRLIVASIGLVGVCWLGWVPYAWWHNGWLVPAWMCLLGFLATHPDARLSAALSHRWMQRLGNASYGLYILHVPFLYWVAGVGKRRFHEEVLARPFVAMACVVGLIGLSMGVHRWVEVPCRNRLRNQSTPER